MKILVQKVLIEIIMMFGHFYENTFNEDQQENLNNLFKIFLNLYKNVQILL